MLALGNLGKQHRAFRAKDGFPERKFEIYRDVTPATRAPSTEKVAEDIPHIEIESVREISEL